MPEIKVMSWNIQTFGTTKLNRNATIDFIAMVIDRSRAGIVGIMEIRGQDGYRILARLLHELNTRRNDEVWYGVISEPLFDINDEQYIYLWDISQGIQADSFSFITPGILSENAFDFITDDRRQTKFIFSKLFQNNILFENYFLNLDATNQLARGIINLDFLTEDNNYYWYDGMLDEIREVILQHRNLGLNDANTRPPFQAIFQIGPDNYKLPVVLLHAPSPKDPFVAMAINVLGNIEMLLDHNQGLIMGDFNIPGDQNIKDQVILINGETHRGKNGDIIMRGAFQGIEDFGFQEVLNQPTSLKKIVYKGANAPQGYLSSNYDRFFLRLEDTSPFAFLSENHAEVHDVIRLIQESGNGNTNAEYENLALAVLREHSIYRNSITSIRRAHKAFRKVSDHLPILITLNY